MEGICMKKNYCSSNGNACGVTWLDVAAHHQTIPARIKQTIQIVLRRQKHLMEKNPVTIRFYNYALSETAKADWWENTIANFEKKTTGLILKQSQ